ncbi:MAG TPA: ATP synthase F1 subunit epsilon [Anaerolineales bacterium]|nr:ATP synthase F1 subunit epsilon [Anaerolineales bacterium]HRQ93296.1 ATP synthase F1 subunit epsilon [Anaerolineales bacterium]
MTIRCEIVSQDRSVFEGDADIVTIPGHDGEMGILPNHVPLLSTIRPGVVKVRQGTEEHLFTVTGGLAEIQPDIVTILADAAEDVEEIDVARAERAKREAEQRLAEGLPRGTEAYLAAEAALARSSLRLDVARRFGRANRHSRFPTQSSGE